MVGDAGEHVGKVMLRVEAVELGTFNQRIDRGGAAATGIGAGKQIIFTANGDAAFIVPLIPQVSGNIGSWFVEACATRTSLFARNAETPLALADRRHGFGTERPARPAQRREYRP